MKKLILIAALVAAACAASTAPTPVESASASPSAADLAAPLNASPADIVDISCRPAEPGCYTCTYTVLHRGDGEAAEEPRADKACNITGGWTVSPMSAEGS